MQTATIEKKKYTYDDYLKTPEDKRYELIQGELIMTPSPVTYHQWLSKNILYELEKLVREKKIGKVFDAPCDVYLDEENVLQPDILFISNERTAIIGEKNVFSELVPKFVFARPKPAYDAMQSSASKNYYGD